MRRFVHQTRFAASPEAVFAFHERDDVLELLKPPNVTMRVISRTGGLRAGARVEFRIYLGPIYVTWVAVHTAYERNRVFIDEQARGPFTHWRHEHSFIPDGDGCILSDNIEYSVPLGLTPILGWLVDRKLRGLFVYRHETTARHLPLT